jgi:hypothetical protein
MKENAALAQQPTCHIRSRKRAEAGEELDHGKGVFIATPPLAI